ncbi:MAG: nucleotidyl transferase AbiEii/AbiGii toxin family protein [bacterium]
MDEIKPILINLLEPFSSKSKTFQRNILKEYFQIMALDYIYSHKDYSQLTFYGGSCLRHCYGLPRLSEDLDFVDGGKKMNIPELATAIEKYFLKSIGIKAKAVTQKFRIYLKFPLLRNLGLAAPNESDFLFLKVEIFSGFDFCRRFETEIVPLFKFNKSLLIKTFDISTLMATKIRAIFLRRWEKADKTGKTIIRVKGRDYFDLLWYLDRGIKPNLSCIDEVRDYGELKEKLLIATEKADSMSIQLDLESFISEEDFVKKLSINLKEILKRKIQEANW